jgi:hypothetical protein
MKTARIGDRRSSSASSSNAIRPTASQGPWQLQAILALIFSGQQTHSVLKKEPWAANSAMGQLETNRPNSRDGRFTLNSGLDRNDTVTAATCHNQTFSRYSTSTRRPLLATNETIG